MDKDFTLFFAALRNMAVPDAGDLLTVGSGDWFCPLDGGQLYVRKCYPDLFKAIYESTNKNHVVTGTPGIGKSYFFYYMLLRLLHSPSPPPFILWEHHRRVWCYTHETGQVWLSNCRMAFRREFRNRDSWYFADDVSPDPTSRAHTVLITSPVYATWKGMENNAAVMLYMPLWEYEELLDCRSKMFGEVPEATVEDLYNCYGGVARYVLMHPSVKPGSGLPKLLEPLTEVVHCFVDQFRVALRAIYEGSDAIHRLVHIVADDKFRKKDLSFATKWVADKFVNRALIREQEQLISLLESSDGGLQANLYESVMHAVLAKGGKFDVVPLHPETLERGNEEKLDIQVCKQSHTFKDDEASGMASTDENTYLRPFSSKFPVIDAVRMPEMYLFQMALSDSSKEINADELEDVFKRLGIPAPSQEDLKPSLYFVVDPSVYDTFKVQAATKKQASGQDGKEQKAAWPPYPKEKYVRSANTRLYILCGTYRQPLGLSARMGSLHHGRVVPVKM